ncbi:MAG: hypothetical protein MUW56_10885 [Chryseobacterium sp.]|uniref:hypothetical protein n=1 Tax=Chryseobacterium sp. TaxID=1871047 RepID=UPI0025B907E5|nr:hypothetical protein [Chryseobacterium sp.]MCJ7934115.1 hypothetical protein [Chryseobacterium sp.]
MENKIFRFLIAYAVFGLFLNCASSEIEDGLRDQSSNGSVKSSSTASKFVDYSGEEYYRGIFLFEGKVADEVPHFSDIKKQVATMPLAAQKGQLEFNNDIIEGIKALNPGYFDQLKKAVESKNLTDIDNIMDVGATLAEAAIISSPKYQAAINQINDVQQKIDITKYNLDTTDGLNEYLKDVGNLVTNSNKVDLSSKNMCIWLAAVVAVAIWDGVAIVNYGVIVNAAAVAMAYAAVYAKVKFWGPKKSSFSQTIREQVVLEISNIN